MDRRRTAAKKGNRSQCAAMDDLRIGAAFRAVRIRRRLRQVDVAERAGVSRAFVSLVERGHLDRVSLGTLRTLGRALDIRIDAIARWRGGELDRLVNARHSVLHESVAGAFTRRPGWTIVPEVSFSVYGERGAIDLLAFHRESGCLLVIELKSEIVDVNELVGTLDRKARLAPGIALGLGWTVKSVSRWVDRRRRQDQPATRGCTSGHAACRVPAVGTHDARLAPPTDRQRARPLHVDICYSP